jgi:hypothetical protein
VTLRLVRVTIIAVDSNNYCIFGVSFVSSVIQHAMCKRHIVICSLPRSRRWEDNIKMDLQEVGGGLGDWMELAQDRDGWRALVSTVKNFRVPYKCGEFLD